MNEKNRYFYLRRSGVTTGPFSAGVLRDMARRGKIEPENEISGDRVLWLKASAIGWLGIGGAKEVDPGKPAESDEAMIPVEAVEPAGIDDGVLIPEEVEVESESPEEPATPPGHSKVEMASEFYAGNVFTVSEIGAPSDPGGGDWIRVIWNAPEALPELWCLPGGRNRLIPVSLLYGVIVFLVCAWYLWYCFAFPVASLWLFPVGILGVYGVLFGELRLCGLFSLRREAGSMPEAFTAAALLLTMVSAAAATAATSGGFIREEFAIRAAVWGFNIVIWSLAAANCMAALRFWAVERRGFREVTAVWLAGGLGALNCGAAVLGVALMCR